MRFRLLAAIVISCLTSTYCSIKEKQSEGGSVIALMETGKTRTSVTDEGAFTWSYGDKIWLETTSGHIEGNLSSGSGTANAEFSFGYHFGEMTGKAVYPYNSGHSIEGDRLSIFLPSSYELGSSLSNTNAAMYGVNIGGRLNFSHLAGVMRFSFKNVPAGVDRFTITMDKKINGTFTSDLEASNPTIHTEDTAIASEKTVTLGFDALEEVSDINLYVPLPIGRYSSLQLALYNGTRSVWTYSNEVSNSISRKTLKLMPVVSLGGSIGGGIEGGDTQVEKTSEVRLAKQYDLVVGDTFQMFYVGVVKTFNIKNDGIRVVCNVGKQYERYFEYTPTESDAGKSYQLTVTTRKFDGTIVSLGETTLVVHPKLTDVTTPSNVNILIFGDSLTSTDAQWAGEGLRRIYGTNPSIVPASLGLANTCTTYGGKSATVNGFKVYHEGYSGWTWARFLQNSTSNPFYNSADGRVEFQHHADKYGNPGADLIAILLTWNGADIRPDFDFTEGISKQMADAATLIRQAHNDFPNAKIICLGLQVSSLNGGTGESYGASGQHSDPYALAFYAFDYSKALEELVTNDEFGEYCYYIDTKGQFDTEFNMPSVETDANNRNDTDTEIVGTNGVHPTTAGYYQIGDAFYRGLHRVLPVIAAKMEEPEINLDIASALNISADATANCYIISEPGVYKFKPTKGCSDEGVGTIATSSVLWKSFGTTSSPKKSELISATSYKDGYIAFEVPEDFKKGNAVIGAKDIKGNILWSWHIWLTDKPKEHIYNNEAGTVMDRNLGAVSSTPGDIGALGLFYQWGRKDPFPGSSSISSANVSKSYSGGWQTVASTSTTGTIKYATAHPTFFISQNKKNYDWYYTGSSSTDDTRWTTSENRKSIYDPCPAGWRVPDGGEKGLWATASGSTTSFTYSFDKNRKGFYMSEKLAADDVWYPAIGYIYNIDGSLRDTGKNGVYWSATPTDFYAYCFITREDDTIIPMQHSYRSFGRGVRCKKEY